MHDKFSERIFSDRFERRGEKRGKKEERKVLDERVESNFILIELEDSRGCTLGR